MGSEKKIYTKGGDLGETSLLGGTRVSKCNEQVEAYGTLDELNSFVGLLRDQDIERHDKEVLLEVQKQLFVAEAWVAADKEHSHSGLPNFQETNISMLEKEIDSMTLSLAELDHFLLPGGDQAVSVCHVARTVCRRAERIVIGLTPAYPEHPLVIRYLNRLSDYLFVLARKIAKDKGAEEIRWIP